MPNPPDDREPWLEGLEQASRALEWVLQILLGVVAVVVLVGAVCIMVDMDASSRSQGGRVYVAVAAVVALGAVESRFAWLARRRWLLSRPAEYRRYCIRSFLLLLIAGAVLLGLALFLP